MALVKTGRAILITLAPALILAIVLYATGRIGRSASPAPATERTGPKETVVPFAELQVAEKEPDYVVGHFNATRRLDLSPIGLVSVEPVGRDLVIAGTGPLLRLSTDRFTKEGVTYLVPKDADYIDGTLDTVTDLQSEGLDKVWVFDFYGMATLWDISHTAPPLRSVFAVDAQFGGAWSDGRLLTHRPRGNSNLTLLESDGARTSGATLVDGPCCKSLSVEPLRVVREIGSPPFGKLNPGMAFWMGRASVTSTPKLGIALAFLLDSRIVIYDFDGTQKSSTAGPRALPLAFRTKTGDAGSGRIDFMPGAETRLSYVSVTSNLDGVFALFGGGAFGEVGAGRLFSGTEIHSFSWDGRFTGAYRLSEPVKKIAVGDRADRLYGISGSTVTEFTKVSRNP